MEALTFNLVVSKYIYLIFNQPKNSQTGEPELNFKKNVNNIQAKYADPSIETSQTEGGVETPPSEEEDEGGQKVLDEVKSSNPKSPKVLNSETSYEKYTYLKEPPFTTAINTYNTFDLQRLAEFSSVIFLSATYSQVSINNISQALPLINF